MTIDELLSLKPGEPDREIYLHSKRKWDLLAKPIDGLGDLEDIICRIAAIRKDPETALSQKALIIMCSDNGVVKEGVSQTEQKVTYDVASLMGKKKSSVGIMTMGYPLEIMVYDVGINSADTPEGVINKKVCRGTADFITEPAMSREQCLSAIETGIDCVRQCRDKKIDIAATGEMGIGNTTTATALLCAVTGADVKSCTGRGAGLSVEGLKRKTEVIEKGISLYVQRTAGENGLSAEGTFEILRCLGGADIAALTGVFIGGALYDIPIVIDGLISAVAALIAEKLVPGCRKYMIASHMGKEKGMEIIFKELSQSPVIHANMALGEGTGSVLLFPLLDMALSLYHNGTAFNATSIGQYERFEE